MNKNNSDIINKAKEWLSSPKGQESLKSSLQKAMKRSEKFDQSRQIDPKTLKETFTI
jgi:hypothetical protein